MYPLSTVPWTTIMRWEMKNRYREKHQPEMNPCHVVIEYYPDLFVRGAHTEIQLAAVVRYPYFIKRYGRVSFTRHNVFLRDGFRCQYTGERFPASKLTIDHVIPLAQGGKSTWENVVACGPELNWKKRDRTPQQAGLKLIRQPRQPTMEEINRQAHEHLTMDLSGAHPLWLPYLENAK
jgi:5-methylcytosine-specific restriction endonuclease McrA